MGATSSSRKRYSKQVNTNIYSTPPKINHNGDKTRLVQLQCDPRSPTDGICRTPIQIDSQLPCPSLKLHNNVVVRNIIRPEITITGVNNDDSQESQIRHRSQKLDVSGYDSRRTSGIEPILDPSIVLTALMANHNCQLPPYQL